MYSSLLELLGGDAMLLWLNMKIFLLSWYYSTSKKKLLQSLSVFLKRCRVIFFPIHVLLFGDFLSYSYLTFCVHFRYVCPARAGISSR